MIRIAAQPERRWPPPPRTRDACNRRPGGDGPRPLPDAGADPGVALRCLVTARAERGRPELDPEVRALVVRFVAAATGRVRPDGGRRPDIRGDKLAAVLDHATDPRFLPDERVALAYAAALCGIGADAPDELLVELRRHFSERGIVELIVAVAFAQGRVRSGVPLAVAADGCRVPPRPLPAGMDAA